MSDVKTPLRALVIGDRVAYREDRDWQNGGGTVLHVFDSETYGVLFPPDPHVHEHRRGDLIATDDPDSGVCEHGEAPTDEHTCPNFEDDGLEGCMHCTCCGNCREDVDSDDTCMDCGGIDESAEDDEPSYSTGGLLENIVASGFGEGVR